MTFVCGSQCFLPPGENVRGGGGDLHGVLDHLPYYNANNNDKNDNDNNDYKILGVLDPLPHYNDNNNDKNDNDNNNYKILGVLGSLPHLLHPLLPLPAHNAQGVDLQCLPGGDTFHTFFIQFKMK